MRRASLVAVLACSLAASMPAPGWAAEDAVTRKKVQTYLDLAADLFKAADYEGALTELRRAEALTDLAVVRYNIARCLEELKRDAEAIAAFEKYLALSDATPGASDRQKRAQETVARLSANVPAGPPPGTLEIACPTTGSSVMVIGLMQTPVACPWKSDQVAPGTYDVQTMAPGQQPVLTRAEVASGRTTAVVAQAFRAASAAPEVAAPHAASKGAPLPPVPVKFLAARDGDEMSVTVDGNPELSCKAPCEMQLTPGKHTFAVSGAANYEDAANIPRGSASVAKMGRSRGGFLALGLTSVIVGPGLFLVGLAGGTYGVFDAAPALGLMGAGIVVAVVGGVVGFKLKGHNAVEVDRDRDRGGRASLFDPRLLSVGVAPTRDGAMAGALIEF